MKTINMHDWGEWQSYRSDRNAPPWIKIHRNIMSNVKWSALSDAEKGQLVSMWVVASDNKGKLPADPTTIKKICLLDGEPNLCRFNELGFIDGDLTSLRRQDDVNVTSGWRQRDAADKSRVEENREEKKKHSCLKSTEKTEPQDLELPPDPPVDPEPKKTRKPRTPKSDTKPSDPFMKFWAIWCGLFPERALGRAKAWLEWQKKKLDGQADTVIFFAQRMAEYNQVTDTPQKFVPHPERWIKKYDFDHPCPFNPDAYRKIMEDKTRRRNPTSKSKGIGEDKQIEDMKRQVSQAVDRGKESGALEFNAYQSSGLSFEEWDAMTEEEKTKYMTPEQGKRYMELVS